MENHHAAAAMTLLERPDTGVLPALCRADQDRLRRTVIDMVLVSHYSPDS